MATVSGEEAAAACAEVLAGLDADTLDYVAGGVLDEDSGEVLPKVDLVEMVAPMLEELTGGDTDAAEALAGKLWERLTGGQGLVEAVEEAPRALAAAVHLGDNLGVEDEAEKRAAAAAAADKLATMTVDDRKARAAAAKAATKEAERAAEAARRMVEENAALAAEVQTARERAVRIQMTQGRGRLGSLELGPFALPNPGGGAELLEDASMVLVPGRKYALIGRNGKGKSTLLKAAAARRVGALPDSLAVYYVNQEVALSPELEAATPVDVVLEADVERALLLQEREQLADQLDEKAQARLSEVEERLVAIGADRARERAAALLSNLGFSDKFLARRMDALSGGWRVRTCLAAALFAKPDLLLLDEPTNHLSIDAVLWLSRELSTNSVWDDRIVVVVSHDRYFLDDACTDTLHISGAARRLTQSRGSYTAWAKRRAEQQKAWKHAAELRAQKRDKLKEYTSHGFKYGGSSGQINMQQKKLKEMAKLDLEAENEAEELAALNEDEELPLNLEAGGLLDKSALALCDVGFQYPGTDEVLFTGADFTLDSKSRVCLLGENGTGKTTLVKIIQGKLEVNIGEVKRASGVRIEVVNQHHADQLSYDMSPLSFMLQKFPGDGSYSHELKCASLTPCAPQPPSPTHAPVHAHSLTTRRVIRV
mmetsp:Transcript_1826/g.4755  ORF Transcript_1826/g.4755 Transcript_1826/m.4755 type:complete len:654 (+) Transcript_1826:192-2153(+)